MSPRPKFPSARYARALQRACSPRTRIPGTRAEGQRFIVATAFALLAFFAGALHARDWQTSGARLSLTFTADQTDFASEVRDADLLPDGSIAFVTQRSVTTFDGNKWRSIAQSPDMGALLATAEGRTFISMEGRIWEITPDALGRPQRSELTAPLNAPAWGFKRIERMHWKQGELYALSGDQIGIFAATAVPIVINLADWAADLVLIGDEIFVLGGSKGNVVNLVDRASARVVPADARFQAPRLTWSRATAPRQEGGVWVAAPNGVIFSLTESGAAEFVRAKPAAEAVFPEVTALAELPDGRLAVGSRVDGVQIYDTEGNLVETLSVNTGLSDNGVKALLVDGDNGLWVVTRRSVSRHTISRRIVVFNESHGLTGAVSAVARHRGTLYVGTDVGLHASEPDGSTQSFRRLDGFSAIHVLIERGHGLIFGDHDSVGILTDDGVTRFAESGVEFMIQPASHPDWIFFSRSHAIAALRRIDGVWTRVQLPASFAVQAYGFAESKDGWIWAGLGVGKLARFRSVGENFAVEMFDTSHGVPERWALPVVVGDAVLTASNPVLSWSEQERRFVADKSFDYYPGTPPYGFDQLLVSRAGDVWVSPGAGDGNLLPRPAAVIVAAIVSAGMNIDTRARALWYDSDNVAWLGCDSGLLRCENAFAASPPLTTPVGFFRLKSIADRKVLLTGARVPASLDVPYAHRSLQVEATLPDFSSTHFQRFRIYLEGFDSDWGEWSQEATRDFTNLPVGSYTLHVQACDAQNRRAPGITLPLRILPPLYRTPLAYFSYVMLTISLVTGFVKLRVRHLDRRNRELGQSVAARTREVSEQTELLRVKNRELSETLRKAEQLAVEARAASESKGLFLANMSHEIRTPMNGVIGMCSLLADTKLDPEQQDFVQTIRNSGEGLLAIINDILDFSKADSGQIRLERIPLDLATLTDEVLDLLASQASQKNLELVADIDPAFARHRLGDPTRLRQILLNLVGNALKFTTHGEVVVTIERARHSSNPDQVLISVRDTGPGIPPEKQRALFQPFSQVDASTTRRFGGTGLGLAICRQLVESMGGNIGCENALGGGTVFHFDIPLAIHPSASDETRSRDILRGAHILLVDDHATARRVLERHLEHWGASTVVAPDASTALQQISSGAVFASVLIDRNLLDGEGLTLARAIRDSGKAAKRIPLVLLNSAGRSTADVKNAPDVDAVLPKPVRFQSLVDTLARLHAGLAHDRSSTEGDRLAPIKPLAEVGELRVLLAEDNVVNQKMALLMLGRLGLRADVVGNGLEVIETLQRQSYDLVLMDVQMPELDGLETTRRIRVEFPADRTPRIVALTAGAAQFDQRACLDAGMDAFMAKPFKPDELAATLQAAVAWKIARTARPGAAPTNVSPTAS